MRMGMGWGGAAARLHLQHLKNKLPRGWRDAQWLRLLAALAEETRFDFQAATCWLTNISNSRSRGPASGLSRHCTHVIHRLPCKQNTYFRKVMPPKSATFQGPSIFKSPKLTKTKQVMK